jgi:hypothetical protein
MKTLSKPKNPIEAIPGSAFEQLDATLRLLVAEHQKLLALADEHRRAIMQADAQGLNACLAKQSEVVQRVSDLERRRQGIVLGITRSAPPKPGSPAGRVPTMSEVTIHAPEPVRGRLTSVAGALRELLNTLHQKHRALKQAAETLSQHMEGLMRQVCRELSHTGTYARRGSINSSVQVVSAVDLRS